MPQDGRRKLKTVDRSFEILETLQDLDGARVTELSNYMGLPTSTVHSHLSTLEQRRYVVQEGDEYHVGLRFLGMGGYARERKEGYVEAAEMVENLAEKTGERAQFLVEEHGKGIYLHMDRGKHAVRTDARIGKESFMHASSAGKAILANLPETRIDTILDRRGLTPLTENTITDRGVLYDELEEIRNRGYSINYQESTEGLRAIGVPVRRSKYELLGAFSVSGPVNRLKGDVLHEEIPELLLGTANELELNIAYPQ